jgi:hypothetical protein
VASYMETVKPVVDKTIFELSRTKFRPDPIGGLRYSRMTSIVSSAYKRHGQIIERALIERLKESNRFQVWSEKTFSISAAAHNLATNNPSACLKATLPYGDIHRTTQVDMVVYDFSDRVLRSYEIKRGNGDFDAGKQRSILIDLLAQQVLLKSYGEQRGLDVSSAEAKIIFYYGRRSIKAPFSLIGAELDAHFKFEVVGAVEIINEYFRERLYDLLEQQ